MHPHSVFHRLLKSRGAGVEFARLEWETRHLLLQIVAGLSGEALIEQNGAAARAEEAITELTGSPILGAIARATVAHCSGANGAA